MESDLQHHHQQYQQKQMNSGLTRYQSAPSSYFSGFLEREFCEEFLNKPSSPETQRIFAKFLGGNMDNINNNNISNQNLCTIKPDSPVREAAPHVNQQLSTMAPMDDNDNIDNSRLQQQLMNNYSSPALQSCYQNQSKPPLPDQKPGSVMNFRPVTSMGMDQLPPMKTGGVNNSNLIRHSSSPAGLFSNISIEFENEYAVLRAVGDFGVINRETSYSAASRPHASSGPMSPISEIGGKNISENNAESSGFGESRGDNYVTGFTVGSWDDSVMTPAGAKRLTDEDRSLSGLNAIETQSVGETGIHPLAHHLSLPKTSAEISAIEKFLHLQDSVPCKIRAKRGCATHPRSIAERVRRTRISARMRKLQDLVPNMDKQTNTADMLDLAVDYIKDLQRQVKALSENRKNCRCSTKQEL